jgi:hypothetical protein
MVPGATGPTANSFSLTRKENHMPILLWLVGIPIPLIILILLLR